MLGGMIPTACVLVPVSVHSPGSSFLGHLHLLPQSVEQIGSATREPRASSIWGRGMAEGEEGIDGWWSGKAEEACFQVSTWRAPLFRLAKPQP